MKTPKEPKIVFAASITEENRKRIELVAKELHEKGLTTFLNKTAAADKLLDLGYHTYRLLNPTPELSRETVEEIMRHARQLVQQQTQQNQKEN